MTDMLQKMAALSEEDGRRIKDLVSRLNYKKYLVFDDLSTTSVYRPCSRGFKPNKIFQKTQWVHIYQTQRKRYEYFNSYLHFYLAMLIRCVCTYTAVYAYGKAYGIFLLGAGFALRQCGGGGRVGSFFAHVSQYAPERVGKGKVSVLVKESVITGYLQRKR